MSRARSILLAAALLLPGAALAQRTREPRR